MSGLKRVVDDDENQGTKQTKCNVASLIRDIVLVTMAVLGNGWIPGTADFAETTLTVSRYVHLGAARFRRLRL